MRIVITGGGTGGHIYPALAVAEALIHDPQVEDLLYIGNRTSLESELVPQNGIPFENIYFYGMPRRPGMKWIQWCLDLREAIEDAKGLLEDIRPHVVFGTGGYVSAPVLMSARQLGIPYMIHEPDAHPGLVNRLMACWADRVTGAFAESNRLLKSKKFHATGNPLRENIMALYHQKPTKAEAFQQLGVAWDPNRPVLLVTGGSQGARKINQAVVQALPVLLEELGLQIIHQTGSKLYAETIQQVPASCREHPAYRVQPYFTEMAPVLGAADFALCRSGSLSLSEMYLCGLPTILVPYPFAAADHQRKNAMASMAAGASVMIEDAACTAEQVITVVRGLLADPERLRQMQTACRLLAHPEATQEIVGYLKTYDSGI